MESKSRGLLRILPSRETKTEIQVASDEITLKTSFDLKKFRFDKVFSKSHTNQDLWSYLCRGSNNIVSSVLSGTSISIISYGEVNTGKTYSLFGQEDSSDLFSTSLSELFSHYSGTAGISIWEILYSPTDRVEQIIDLLKISDFKPLPHTLTQDFISVEINNASEGVYIFECAKELSPNWKARCEGGCRSLNNRSHFFVRITVGQACIYIVDLAGALPSNLLPEVRVKLGSDEQLNYTRIGLNQFRSIVWEMAKNPGVGVDVLTASRKSKLAMVISPILATCANIFFSVVREESVFDDIVKDLCVLQRAQTIKVCQKNDEICGKTIPLTVFTQRHKVAKYWEYKPNAENIEEIRENKIETKVASRSSLKEQISQMINELDETPVKKEVVVQDTVVYNNSFDIPYSKIETSFVKERNEILENEIEEIRTTFELEIENLKLENCNLRQKIRAVQDNSNFINIFNIYEEEIKKLENQVKMIREEYAEKLNIIEKSIDIENNSDDEISILQLKHKKSMKDLAIHVKSLETYTVEKEKEISELRKNERKWHMSRKCFENVSRKSAVLENVVGKQSKFLQSNESTFQEMMDELDRLNKEVESLRKSSQDTQQYNERLIEELKIMKDIASTSGMPEETLKRIHKNLQVPLKAQGDFAISLIMRLQKELTDKRQSAFLDNVIHEVQTIITALEESQIREKNLFELLLELQKRIDKDDSIFSRETNKLLRKTLISQLIS